MIWACCRNAWTQSSTEGLATGTSWIKQHCSKIVAHRNMCKENCTALYSNCPKKIKSHRFKAGQFCFVWLWARPTNDKKQQTAATPSSNSYPNSPNLLWLGRISTTTQPQHHGGPVMREMWCASKRQSFRDPKSSQRLCCNLRVFVDIDTLCKTWVLNIQQCKFRKLQPFDHWSWGQASSSSSGDAEGWYCPEDCCCDWWIIYLVSWKGGRGRCVQVLKGFSSTLQSLLSNRETKLHLIVHFR